MPLNEDRLQAVVAELLSRPGHEKVRSLIYDLLVHGLGAASGQVLFEKQIREVRGRADALLGRTVFEFKRDLRVEQSDAESQLTRYIRQRQEDTRQHYIGIATDGSVFIAYELRDKNLVELARYTPSIENSATLLAWLDTAVALQPEISPEPDAVRKELGRESLAYFVAHTELARQWQAVKATPDVDLKRTLWADLLQMVYGESVDADDLFFQHTYLTVVAKTMATRALGIPLPQPADLLSGKAFRDASITGAVESDFFDWILDAPAGDALVSRIAAQAGRFRLQDVQQDVLKELYESLIDPTQRHQLGEYYTPDWLADLMVREVVTDPLAQRVLDPSCGSGTFLFHSVRHFLEAADKNGKDNAAALAECTRKVLGVDIHPVAALIARVTYLLALGPERLIGDRGSLAIPVYLGDSLQWNTEGFIAGRDVVIRVPDGPQLHFPTDVVADLGSFEQVVQMMLNSSEQDSPATAFRAWLQREKIAGEWEQNTLMATYQHLCDLRAAGRDHIWGYVVRNQARPVWLSSVQQRANIIIGNPPWLAYRHMSGAMQVRFREECQRRGIWIGGRFATQQDLSAYFFARCVELYAKRGAAIAFVLPYAMLHRKQYEGFRTGRFGSGLQEQSAGQVKYQQAWTFDESVKPLFPLPSCVLIGRVGTEGTLPSQITAYTGQLPRRDATPAQAAQFLSHTSAPWPIGGQLTGGSAYREKFRNGATLFPRMLCIVEEIASVGILGTATEAPNVQSRRTSQEDPHWKQQPSLQGQVEREFLRPVYLGSCLAPFRLLTPASGVIPWESETSRLLDSAAAQQGGYPHLGAWLAKAEHLWDTHGTGSMRFGKQIDYYGKLRAQFPTTSLRLVYAKAGKKPAAAIVDDATAVIDHKLYWASLGKHEALYLLAILNSETVRSRISHMQSRGQGGARDFDKLMFELLVPLFNAKDSLHQQLAAAAQRAVSVAAAVPLNEDMYFTTARKHIRAALQDDGIAQEIEELVKRLLDSPASGSRQVPRDNS